MICKSRAQQKILNLTNYFVYLKMKVFFNCAQIVAFLIILSLNVTNIVILISKLTKYMRITTVLKIELTENQFKRSPKV